MMIHPARASDEQPLVGSFASRPGGRLALVPPPPDSRPAATFFPPSDPDEPPDDAYDEVWDLDDPEAPMVISEQDFYDADLPPMSAVDQLEWELWASADQDEAERFMLRQSAPDWVFLPPGGDLAAALGSVRVQCLSPMALIEYLKAASRLASWAEAMKASAMASFFRQRKAQEAETPRPEEIDSSGRPVDPERSWAAEVGAALHLSPNTAVRHIETALHLTGPLAATFTALRTGALSHSKALAISEATRALSDDDARAVESHVLRRASSQTHANLRRSLRHQVAKHQADVEADRHREAVSGRTCKIVPLADGMAGLWIVHTADNIQKIWVVVQALADLAKRPTPTPTPEPTEPTEPTGPMPTAPSASADHEASCEPAASTASAVRSLDAPEFAQPAADSARTAMDSAGSTAHGHAAPGGRIASEATPGDPFTSVAGARETDAGTRSHSFGSRIGMSAEPNPAESDLAKPDPAVPSPAVPNPAVPHPAESNWPESNPAEPNPAESKPTRDERTAEQRRADSVADLFGCVLSNGLDWLGRRLPDQHRRRPHIEVLIPVGTLLSLDDETCELTGYGPIPAEMARRIAADGTWRRLLTDPVNGVVLNASTTRHDPSPMVSETLLARHPVCAWPGCNRSSRECDRDHGTPFAVSGRTSLAGLAPYCEYHHVIKDTPRWGWRTENHPDGSVTLIAPTGHRYTTVPPARGPITRTPNRAHPTSARSDPGHPDPVHPDPVHPDPVHPDPVHPNPGKSARSGDGCLGDARVRVLSDGRAGEDPPPF